jgi:N-acetylneuraminic acid mutarotase
MYQNLEEYDMKKNLKCQMRCYTLISIFLILFLVTSVFTPAISLAQELFTEKAPMPTARLSLGTCVVDGKIYAIGGLRTETVPLSVVEVYDPVTDSWDTTKAPMPTARGTFGCTAVDGKIYAIGGGLSGPYPLSIVEVYDPATDIWDTTRAPMQTPRSDVAACTVNGKIYVIGGTTQNSTIFAGTGIVEEYDPVTNSWTRKTDKPTPGWGLRACVLEGKIYITGGNVQYPSISAVVEVYDPVKDEWNMERTKMPEPKYSHSICAFNGNIYSFGGWNNCSTGPMYKKVQVYNPIADQWFQKTDMPFAIGELSAVTAENKIYIIGGTSTLHPFKCINNVYEYDTHLDLLSLIEKVNVSRSFVKPGIDSVMINTKMKDPTGITLMAEIEAPDQTPVDSLHLFDDGNHNDGDAGDSLYANVWPVSSEEEQTYYVDLQVTRVDTDTVIDHMNNMALFTTIGSIVIEDYTFTAADTVPNPGDRIRMKLTLMNNSTTATATNIAARLSSSDSLVDIITGSQNYDDIAAGSRIQCDIFYVFDIAEDHPVNTGIPFVLEILSENYIFWRDTFQVHIYQPTAIAEEKENIPKKYTLLQNYPNPFNPITLISYQLAKTSEVELSIYNILGQKVATLVSEKQQAGQHQVQWDASGFASGVYFYQLRTNIGFIQTKKLILLR